jgi:hypothetical protein
MDNLLNHICNICTKKIDNLEIDFSITICKHVYHTSCLLNYMQKSYFCPKCRKELLENKFETDDCFNNDIEKINKNNINNINNLFNFSQNFLKLKYK